MAITKCEECVFYLVLDTISVCTAHQPFCQGAVGRPTKEGWPVVEPEHKSCGEGRKEGEQQ